MPERRIQESAYEVKHDMRVCRKIWRPRTSQPIAPTIPTECLAARVFRKRLDPGCKIPRRAVAENTFVGEVAPQNFADNMVIL
jgi:hypothetical protein